LMDYKINYVTYSTWAYTSYITYLQCNTYTAYSTIQSPTILPLLLTIQMLTLLTG